MSYGLFSQQRSRARSLHRQSSFNENNEANKAANEQFLIDLCKEATTYVKYKPLGGGRRVNISDNVSYVVPDNLGRAIKEMSQRITINQGDFIKELAEKLKKVNTNINVNGRSEWTKRLYENPFYILREINTKILLIDNNVSGSLNLANADMRSTLKDVQRLTQIEIIKNKKAIKIGRQYTGEEADIFKEIEKFLGKDDSSTVKKYMPMCHQGILADIMTPYYKNHEQTQITRAELLLSTSCVASGMFDFKINLDTKEHLLFFRILKKFDKERIKVFDEEIYSTLLGDNYEQLLLRPTGFISEGIFTIDFDRSTFTSGNLVFKKN
ncbi:hypothetical protein [Francisella uliginis]|uniref:Uncharacterized protein n=1 Tax=Francisella uliginis TaxID=573570 RepID=A0A1L4BQC3_9GAMM|nr:hypothetical protein [Francisella uliginis]API86038.1 hypothetical protein F7310_01100 [Francisella uliginis]